jgi:hypothetical protein
MQDKFINQAQSNPLDIFPKEIWQTIFSFLPRLSEEDTTRNNWMNVFLTCKIFHEISFISFKHDFNFTNALHKMIEHGNLILNMYC